MTQASPLAPTEISSLSLCYRNSHTHCLGAQILKPESQSWKHLYSHGFGAQMMKPRSHCRLVDCLPGYLWPDSPSTGTGTRPHGPLDNQLPGSSRTDKGTNW